MNASAAHPNPDPEHCIGLMSGTSMDGVDAVLASFSDATGALSVRTRAAVHLPFPPALQQQLQTLQQSGPDELHREALAGNDLARLYAQAVHAVLAQAKLPAGAVRVIGAHGQTVRHRPELGYTRQIGNPALLAELTGIDVVADLRSRDVAAGGQGAPLVPAFHQALFASPTQTRVLANIGGIANISVLRPDAAVVGFDTGPGNVLLDTWCARHRGTAYDAHGAWAASGKPVAALLQTLLEEPYLRLAPPKSTGRDLFHAGWLEHRLAGFADLAPVDVQATLSRFTAITIAEAVRNHAEQAQAVFVCGGGAFNTRLLADLAEALSACGCPAEVSTTDALGIPPQQVEALAFGWLAWRHLHRQPGNLPAVTGAAGARILGALYPA